MSPVIGNHKIIGSSVVRSFILIVFFEKQIIIAPITKTGSPKIIV